MADLKGLAKQTASVTRLAEGADVYLKMLRDGTLTVASWIAALSLEGRVFTATAGEGTTVVTFGDGGLDTDEYDFHIAVPASVVIIPLHLTITYEAFGTATLVENVMQSGAGSVIGTTGGAVTAYSSNLNAGISSQCTINEVNDTGGTTLASNVKEIYRSSDQLSITTATVGQIRSPYVYRWNAKDSGVYDVVGPSEQLVVFASSQAGTGFICVKYLELPVAAVN